jgi:muramoyltetrapeptide carboxypeptidase
MKFNRRNFISTAGLASLSIPLLGAEIKKENQKKNNAVTVKPAALKPGDTIAITSPAGAVWDDTQIEKFVLILQNFGFKIKLGLTLKEKNGYFSGSDEFRAKELSDFFLDKEISGIFSMKGGWGCARILDKINYTAIHDNPKVLIGFSDITSLLIAITAKTGLVTFHGPVGNSGWNDFTSDYFKRVLIKKEAVTYAYPDLDKDPHYTINSGKVEGVLVGGNLTVLAGIIGSDYLPSWENKILFLEETSEEPYRIDRMLTQLKLAGVLTTIKGFIFGKCVKCDAEEPLKAFTLKEVLEQHLKPLGIPSFYGAMIGHIENKYTLPLGIKVEMDADKGIVTLLESAVV